MKYFLLINLLIFLATHLFAQDKDTLRTYLSDPIVVTGTRIEMQKSEIPASISVVTRDEINALPLTNVLPALEANVPGLFLNNHNMLGYGIGPSSAGNITIRGIGGSPNTQVLVLIDGQPQFMGIFGHPINDSYMASNIERVEVIRGPGSILYGSNAMGGAINIITRKLRQTNGLSLDMDAAYGSFNSNALSASAGFDKEKYDLFVSANHQQTDGSRSDVNDAFRNNTTYAKFGYAFSPNWQLTVDGSLTDARFNSPGPVNTPTDNDQRDYLRGRGALSLENKQNTLKGAFKAFYNYGQHDFTTGFHSTDFNRGITFYQSLNINPVTVVTAGVDYKNWGGKAKDDSVFAKGYNITHTLNELDFYALWQQKLYEKISIETGGRIISNSEYKTEFVPTAGLSYKAAESTTLKASISKGFRSPSILELFFYPPANEELKPERLWNYEAGIEKTFLHHHLGAELTFFQIEGSNLIQEILISSPPPTRLNSGSFKNKGVEFNTWYYPLNRFQLRINYSYLDASEQVLYAPRHNIKMSVSYSFDRLKTHLQLMHVRGLITSLTPGVPSENFTTLDLNLSYNLFKNFDMYIWGRNLLDEKYEIDKGYPLPGRNFMTGIQVNY